MCGINKKHLKIELKKVFKINDFEGLKLNSDPIRTKLELFITRFEAISGFVLKIIGQMDKI